VTTFTGFPPVQVLLSQMTPDDLFTYNKGMPTVWSEGTPLVLPQPIYQLLHFPVSYDARVFILKWLY